MLGRWILPSNSDTGVRGGSLPPKRAVSLIMLFALASRCCYPQGFCRGIKIAILNHVAFVFKKTNKQKNKNALSVVAPFIIVTVASRKVSLTSPVHLMTVPLGNENQKY